MTEKRVGGIGRGEALAVQPGALPGYRPLLPERREVPAAKVLDRPVS